MRRWLLAALLCGAFCTAAVAEDAERGVHVRSTAVRERPSFLGRVVGRLAYGDRLQVVGRSGPWRRVHGDLPEVAGWVHASALTPRRVVLQAGEEDVEAAASNEELALAGKGFNQEVEAEYKSRHRDLDFTWVDRMERIVYDAGELERFLRRGGLGEQGGAP